jgi:hypothetical protein
MFTLPTPVLSPNLRLLSTKPTMHLQSTSRKSDSHASKPKSKPKLKGDVQIGQFIFKFSVDESGNLNPLPQIFNASTNSSLVAARALPSLQVQMHLFVGSSAPIDISDHAAVTDYLLVTVPTVAAATYRLNINQIVNVDVTFDKEQWLGYHGGRKLLSTLTSTEFYVSFVIIPSPIANATSIFALNIASTSMVSVITQSLITQGIVLDTQASVKVITVLMPQTQWYQENGVVQVQTVYYGDSFTNTMIAMVVIAGILLGVGLLRLAYLTYLICSNKYNEVDSDDDDTSGKGKGRRYWKVLCNC